MSFTDGVGPRAEILNDSNFSTVSQVFLKNAQMHIETILHILLKYKVDHAIFS